ncbi:Threonine/homoserine/homoserine lactone efflux protein [Jannaschia faecimaris]|uniref:Threonine/homoserine/homoserine lactone efflux protein n=1 Tax=Jannaschia faecimaris TaxID=1244108 RepID=A0A1H3LSQ9_9RHOB|nr:LysE family translocator [Jannaschia faecimaris]SDY67462.1 Threonine/homoserine/homoserine lactone efflux protein [Jannaschia faecimaris]
MSIDILLALAGFAFVSSITPGPNNLMLMASGANFGLLRSIPHALGIAVGFTVMIVVVGLGLSQVFDTFSWARPALAALSVVYLLYLAWKIANAAPPDRTEPEGTPMTFLQAAAFQWVNPKAWTMALTAVTLYSNGSVWSVVAVAGVFGVINVPCISSWTLLGRQMRRLLTSPIRLRAFNWTMAALLVASLIPSVAPLL